MARNREDLNNKRSVSGRKKMTNSTNTLRGVLVADICKGVLVGDICKGVLVADICKGVMVGD
jgi:hypothetical protein